jgi:UPF0271 protein
VQIDLNADVGEGGDDERLIPLVSSANIACGAHAGDPATIERAIRIAIRHGVSIGAHPGYPDRDNFGRTELGLSPAEVEATVADQVATLAAAARRAGAVLRHVKAHGALYNRAAVDREAADAIARAVRRAGPGARLVGLAGSALLAAGRDAGLGVIAEAFADRAYEPDGTLRSRRHADAVLSEPAAAAAQAVALAREGVVTAVDGTRLTVRADTICLHGDLPGAVERALAVREALEAAGIAVAPAP